MVNWSLVDHLDMGIDDSPWEDRLDATNLLMRAQYWLGNPFKDEFYDERYDAARLLQKTPTQTIARAVRELAFGDDPRLAIWLLVAYGHERQCQEPGKSVGLDDLEIPKSVWKATQTKERAVSRLLLAAGRCYETLVEMVGDSDAIQRVRAETWSVCFGQDLLMALIAPEVVRDHGVVVFGDTGTGKEGVARAIQRGCIPQKGDVAPSVEINAAAIPKDLIESTLFGHEKGSFTGAYKTMIGAIENANGGTLFLDEVGDLPSDIQVKLLRVMQEKKLMRVGGTRPIDVSVRYIGASNRDLESLVQQRTFRLDLYHRLVGTTITVPTLRDRPDDIEYIAMDYVESKIGLAAMDARVEPIRTWLRSDEVREYHWPGNVRELQTAVRNVFLGLPPRLQPAPVQQADGPESPDAIPDGLRRGKWNERQVCTWYAQRVYRCEGGNVSKAARLLEINRATLRARLGR